MPDVGDMGYNAKDAYDSNKAKQLRERNFFIILKLKALKISIFIYMRGFFAPHCNRRGSNEKR